MDVWYYSHHTVVRANVLAPAIFSKSLDLFSPFFGHKMDFPFRKCRYTFVCIFASTHLRAGSWHRWLGSVHPFGEQQQIRKKKSENTNRHPMAAYFFILSSISFSTSTAHDPKLQKVK